MAKALHITVIGKGSACVRCTEKIERCIPGAHVAMIEPARIKETLVGDLCVIFRHPRANGTMALLRELAHNVNGRPVMICGEALEGAEVLDALVAGASAFISAEVRTDHFAEQLRKAASGHVVLGDDQLSALVDHLREVQRSVPHGLSGREHEVLQLVARGLTYKRIAEHLSISPFTVKNHLHRILRKLGVRTRIEAAQRYMNTSRK